MWEKCLSVLVVEGRSIVERGKDPLWEPLAQDSPAIDDPVSWPYQWSHLARNITVKSWPLHQPRTSSYQQPGRGEPQNNYREIYENTQPSSQSLRQRLHNWENSKIPVGRNSTRSTSDSPRCWISLESAGVVRLRFLFNQLRWQLIADRNEWPNRVQYIRLLFEFIRYIDG